MQIRRSSTSNRLPKLKMADWLGLGRKGVKEKERSRENEIRENRVNERLPIWRDEKGEAERSDEGHKTNGETEINKN